MNNIMMGGLLFLFLLVTLGSAANTLIYETEYRSVVPPARLFKATVLDEDNFFPKIGSKVGIVSVEVLEGDGGVGTVKKITFKKGSDLSYAKQRTEALDKDNLLYTYSLIEGENLSDELEKISYEIEYLAAADGGSVIRSIDTYYTKDEQNPNTFTDELEQRKKRVSLLFMHVDVYLLDNPDEYN